MHFLIHSRKTGKFVERGVYATTWTEKIDRARKFETPTDAAKGLASVSDTSKSHIVLWDGIQLWNVSESKA